MSIFSFIYSLSNLIEYSVLARGWIEEDRPCSFISSQGFRLPLGLLQLYVGDFFYFLLLSKVEIHSFSIYSTVLKVRKPMFNPALVPLCFRILKFQLNKILRFFKTLDNTRGHLSPVLCCQSATY